MLSAEKKYAFTGHVGAVYALESLSPEIVLSGSSDRFITSWDLAKHTPGKLSAQLPAPVYSLCFAREQNLLLAGTGAGSIHVIDLAQKREIKILQLHTAQVFDIRYSPAHGLFFTAGGDGQLTVCSLEKLTMLASRKMASGKVRSIAVHPQEKEIAVAAGDGNIHVIEIPGLQETKVFAAHDGSVNAVCYHPQGHYLLSGGRNAHLEAWDCRNDFAGITSIPAHNYALYDIVFSPDEKLFATASRDKTIKIWDAGKIEFGLRISKEKSEGHVNSVNRLLWNETALISAGDDRSVLGWSINSGE